MKSKPGSGRSGVLAGGNWIIDQVKLIDVYPQREQLANIRSQAQGTGGAPYNVLVDLARLGVPFPLYGAGRVGQDALGERILNLFEPRHVSGNAHDVAAVAEIHPALALEQPAVLAVGARDLRFHEQRLIHAQRFVVLSPGDLDFDRVKARIFHLGYLLLLDALDASDKKFGTKAAALLAAAQAAGLKTSVDVVSEDSDRFAGIVAPALQHVDYCVVNEIEAGKTTGFRVRQANGKLDTVALRHAAGALLQLGVRELVVIHFPEGGFARTRKGEDHWRSSLNLEARYIAGMAGAGDAFCAGVLLGLHEGWELPRCLETGVCVAAASLSHPTCTGGMKSLSACLSLGKKYGYRGPLEPAD